MYQAQVRRAKGFDDDNDDDNDNDDVDDDDYNISTRGFESSNSFACSFHDNASLWMKSNEQSLIIIIVVVVAVIVVQSTGHSFSPPPSLSSFFHSLKIFI